MTCCLPHLFLRAVEGEAGEWGGDGVCERVFGKDKDRGL